jgi:hypothetical protein
VGDVDGVVDVDVVGEGDVLHLDTVASQRGCSTVDRYGGRDVSEPPSTIATTSDSARPSPPEHPRLIHVQQSHAAQPSHLRPSNWIPSFTSTWTTPLLCAVPIALCNETCLSTPDAPSRRGRNETPLTPQRPTCQRA